MSGNSLPLQAVGIVGMVAYFSYLVGDYTGLSGIVSLFCCAVTMSHYALHNISKQQRAAVMSFFETISFMSEGAIFVYVGLDALDPMKWKVSCEIFHAHDARTTIDYISFYKTSQPLMSPY